MINNNHLIYISAGFISAVVIYVASCNCVARDAKKKSNTKGAPAYESLIGNTPMVELKTLSKLLKCRILVKMENMNPGGTGKDRAAKYMIRAAMKRNGKDTQKPIVEGTSGSTGIALASLCNARDIPLYVVIPDDQANEKKQLLERLGATVKVVPCCAISNGNHYVNQARRLADQVGGVFMDQFENLANYEAHVTETGPEIWIQSEGKIDAFVMSAGTGGTIAGVSTYLKSKNRNVKIALADPQGSSLFNRVMHGICYTPEQQERTLRRHRYDSIVEGVGLDRVTANFQKAAIDTAFRVTDQTIVDMAHWLLREEGLFVGSSSALNIAATCMMARSLGPNSGKTLVTIVCDSGQRHLSRFWNKDYIEGNGMKWPNINDIPNCILNINT